MVSREALQNGMTVRSVHGERLGHILALGDGQFCIEKGLFFKKGYFAAYDEIKEVRDGEVILSHGRDRLMHHDRELGAKALDARVRQTIDEAYAPTPVRPIKEGGALPSSPGPDGLWP